jgi:hypothetical protein
MPSPANQPQSNQSQNKPAQNKQVESDVTESEINSQPQENQQHQQLFVALVGISLVAWVLYRSLFSFPVIFDETLGKALFFGLPIWIYVSITSENKLVSSLMPRKLKSGLLRGLALGGLFGFAACLFSFAINGKQPVPAMTFGANQFWWQFFLAMLTAFWESLFFFNFVQLILRQRFKQFDLVSRVLLTALIFMIFHLPNIILRFNGVAIMQQAWLLSLFALGQAFLFASYSNAYTLMLTHAIWGMVLLVHF